MSLIHEPWDWAPIRRSAKRSVLKRSSEGRSSASTTAWMSAPTSWMTWAVMRVVVSSTGSVANSSPPTQAPRPVATTRCRCQCARRRRCHDGPQPGPLGGSGFGGGARSIPLVTRYTSNWTRTCPVGRTECPLRSPGATHVPTDPAGGWAATTATGGELKIELGLGVSTVPADGSTGRCPSCWVQPLGPSGCFE